MRGYRKGIGNRKRDIFNGVPLVPGKMSPEESISIFLLLIKGFLKGKRKRREIMNERMEMNYGHPLFPP